MSTDTNNFASTAEFNLFLDTKQGGEDGTVASIAHSARFYAANEDLRPSMRATKQNRGVAVTNYGGMISNRFGISALTIHSWSNVIASKYDSFDHVWDFTMDEFLDFVSLKSAELLVETTNAETIKQFVGGPSESAAKSMRNAIRDLDKIRLTPGNNISPKALYDFAVALKQANELAVTLNAPSIN